MDQKTTAIDQDVKDIIGTRVAIAEKLELLEQRIIDTAEGATMKFSRMLEETNETVNQVVDKTKAALDPVQKVDEYPWLMLGGAICVGFAIGLMDSRSRSERSGVYPYYPARARASRVMPESARETGATTDQQAQGVYDYYPTGPQSQNTHRTSLWSSMSREFGQEAEEAKAVLLEAGRSLLTELVRKAVPEIARSLGVTLSTQFEKQKDPPNQRPPSHAGRQRTGSQEHQSARTI